MLNYQLAIVTAFVLLGPPAPAAQDEAAAKKGSGRTIELSGTVHGKFTARTAYLSQPIERFHRLSLDGELGGKAGPAHTKLLMPKGFSWPISAKKGDSAFW